MINIMVNAQKLILSIKANIQTQPISFGLKNEAKKDVQHSSRVETLKGGPKVKPFDLVPVTSIPSRMRKPQGGLGRHWIN